MTNKNYAIIPVLFAFLLIPQLLFWWLAPVAATARFVVYIGGTFIICAVLSTLFLTYWKYGLRKTTGLAIVTGILQFALIGVCALLLALNAAIRSAIYALTITGLVHLICMTPMVSSAVRAEQITVSALSGINDIGDSTAIEDAHKALPPRNR